MHTSHRSMVNFNILLVGATAFQIADCFKHFNWYLKQKKVFPGRNGEGMIDSEALYQVIDNDPQRYSFQMDSSHVDPRDGNPLEDPRFTTTLQPLSPSTGLCEDLIPPDENVTLGRPPIPSKPDMVWLRTMWFNLKSMGIEIAPMLNYTFRGFVLQVRYNNTPIGRFRLGGSTLARGVQCPGGGPNNTIYYYRECFHLYRFAEWVPPKWFIGNVHLGDVHMTLIHRPGIYWRTNVSTRFYPYHDSAKARDAYFADRQFFRTLLPKFFRWYSPRIPSRRNVTFAPLSYRPRLKEVLYASPYENKLLWPNKAGMPW